MPYFQPFIGPEFVSNMSMPVASLLTNFPAGASFLGKYARVTDLWGSVEEVMRCSYDGSSYYWRPQRTDYSVNSTQTTGAVTLTPLVSAPSIIMASTLLGNMTITPSVTNAWPGCRFEIVAQNTGLFAISFGGLVGGILTNILGGQTRVLEYTAAGWKGK